MKNIPFLIFILLFQGALAYPVNDSSEIKENSIKIHKYPGNYTCFKMETSSGTTIITDPYNMDAMASPDIVTVSHHHADHEDFSHIKKPGMVIDQDGEYSLKDVKITGIRGLHDKLVSAGNYITSDYTINNIYVFDMEGIRIAQFASQGEMPSKPMLDKIGRIDVLIIQFSMASTKLSIKECAEIAAAAQPKIIIPAHGDPTLSEPFSKLIGGSFRNESGNIVITRKYLDSLKNTEVLVLDN